MLGKAGFNDGFQTNERLLTILKKYRNRHSSFEDREGHTRMRQDPNIQFSSGN